MILQNILCLARPLRNLAQLCFADLSYLSDFGPHITTLETLSGFIDILCYGFAVTFIDICQFGLYRTKVTDTLSEIYSC